MRIKLMVAVTFTGLRHQWRSDVDDWFIILNEDFITIKELEAKAAWVASTKINHVNQERLQWIQRIKCVRLEHDECIDCL